jgi:hypothetical protein
MGKAVKLNRVSKVFILKQAKQFLKWINISKYKLAYNFYSNELILLKIKWSFYKFFLLQMIIRNILKLDILNFKTLEYYHNFSFMLFQDFFLNLGANYSTGFLIGNEAGIKKKKSQLFKFKKLLYTKFFKLKLEKSIFRALKIKNRVYFSDVPTSVCFINAYRLPSAEFFPNWLHKFFFFDELLSVFYYSLYYKNSELLAKFTAKNINNNKRHFNFLKRMKVVLTKLYNEARIFNLVGLFISVHGKFQGHLRKRRFKIMLGQTGRSSFDKQVAYDFKRSYTRWGVFSIKVFLFFGSTFKLTMHEKKRFILFKNKKLDMNIPIETKRLLLNSTTTYLN